MYTVPIGLAILLTMLAGLLIAGASDVGKVRKSCDRRYPVRVGASGNYQYQGRPEIFSYTVIPDMTITRLHMVLEQNQGSVSWKLTDPEGKVRWEGEHEHVGQLDETRDFKPIQGEWKLEINGRDGSGRYDHCWMAR